MSTATFSGLVRIGHLKVFAGSARDRVAGVEGVLAYAAHGEELERQPSLEHGQSHA